MPCVKPVPPDNLAALLEAVNETRKLAHTNNIVGHVLIGLSVLGAIGVAALAYVSGSQTPNFWSEYRPAIVFAAFLPTVISIAEKSLKPAEWEAWYARKALALEAILRHIHSANPPEGTPASNGALPTSIIDWWNKVDEEFEKTRPNWGVRESMESENAKKALSR